MTFFPFFLTVKPRFQSKYLKSYTVVEGESLNITLNATGNPPQIEYKWSFPMVANKAKIHTEASKLTLAKTQRSERGNYTILAWNGHGDFNTTVTLFVDVLFAPRYS